MERETAVEPARTEREDGGKRVDHGGLSYVLTGRRTQFRVRRTRILPDPAERGLADLPLPSALVAAGCRWVR
jgi:hypothetical protein